MEKLQIQLLIMYGSLEICAKASSYMRIIDGFSQISLHKIDNIESMIVALETLYCPFTILLSQLLSLLLTVYLSYSLKK